MTIKYVVKRGVFMDKKKFRLNKQHVISFIAGILVTAILCGIGILIAYEKGLFSNNDGMLGGAILQKYTIVTESDFDAKVLNSSLPELVYFVEEGEKYALYDGFFETMYDTWGRDVKIYYVNDMSRFYLMNLGLYSDGTPLYAIFDKGEVFEQKYLETNQYDIYAWVKDFMTEDTATPKPEPIVPVFYRMYPGTVRQAGFSDEYFNLGELSLLPYKYDHDYSYNCIGSRSLLKKDHEALYALIGDTYGSDTEQFSLPDLSSAVPNSDLYYQIFIAGEFPEYESDFDPITVGDIKYVPTEISYINNDLYIGQIILAKNIDDLDFRGILVPCDGRKLEKAYYTALYTLVGDEFGLTTSVYFYLPDLSSASPIEGAKYYIVATGIYPSRN